MNKKLNEQLFDKHERMSKLKERVMDSMPTIELDRARIITKFYKENESLPILLKRAGSLREVFEKIPVYIRDDELIVGGEGSVPGSIQLYPEYNISFLQKDIDNLDGRLEYCKFDISEEHKKEFLQEIVPYWKGKTVEELAFTMIPDEAKTAIKANIINLSSGSWYGIGHFLPNYIEVAKRGTRAIVSDLRERRSKLDLTVTGDVEKDMWYEGAITILEGLPVWAKKHAVEARRIASAEKNEKRRSELLEIARICEKVPAEPAETFREALQAYWFTHVAVRLEQGAISISMGRFDQDFYPYYKKDLGAGILDADSAEELLECLWVKFNETNEFLPAAKEPYVSRQALTIGGVNAQGLDATNDLTYLTIKVHGSVNMHQPSFSLRCSVYTPDQILMDALRVISNGGGMPALFNDDLHIYSLMNRGASLEDARNYAVIGCVETAPANSSWPNCSAGKFNIPKCLMLALNDGVDIKANDTKVGNFNNYMLSDGANVQASERLGVATGDPRDFKTIDDLMNAFRAQVKHFAKLQVQAENAIEMAHASNAPILLSSVLVDDCIEKGVDLTKGGARYNWTAPCATGQANAGDCLEAIQKAVYDEKFISMDELLKALDLNFEGNEKLRQRLLGLPKYGNDVEEADLMVRAALKTYTDEIARYHNSRGGIYHGGSFPGLSHLAMGRDLGATPDGRKAGDAYAAGLQPVNGRYNSGLIATINSAKRLDYFSASNGTVLTVWLNPSMMKNERGLQNVAAVVRSYFENGQEIQFNVVSSEMLREAQEEPEKHRDLVVRVTGWSSFFTGLAKDVQDEVIERTEILNAN